MFLKPKGVEVEELEGRILAADLDRTLTWGGEDRLSPALAELLRRLKREGWILALVTGREKDYIEGREDLSGLFDGWVLENGVEIFIPETGENHVLLPEKWEDLKRKASRLPYVSFKKWTFSLPKEKAEEFGRMVERWGFHVNLEENRGLIQVLPGEVDKGVGLLELLKALGVEGFVVALGDAHVDLGLFRVADFKVAVGDAEEEVKKVADYVSPFPDGEGAKDVLEKLLQGEFRLPF